MLLLTVASLFWIALSAWSVDCKPFVHSSIKQALTEKGAVTLFVSFKTPDISAAKDPEALSIALGKNSPFKSVMTPEEYHQARGEYVYNTLAKFHAKTRDMLILALKSGQVDEQLIPISNSFIIHKATTETVNTLLELEGIEELVTTNGHRIPLPKPASREYLRPKSFFQSFLAEEGLAAELGDDPVEWNIKKIGADEVWQLGPRGKGIGIVYGIADTGIAYKHPNIASNYMGITGYAPGTNEPIYNHNYAWFDGVRTPIGPNGSVAMSSRSPCPVAGIEPCDDQGHGTHVGSIAVGAKGCGVAPGAKWIACRNMDAGVGAPQAYIACLNFFLAPHNLEGKNPRPELRPHVVGNSYGCPDSEGCSPRALKSAVEALRAAGVFMAVSAGNEGPGCGTIGSPPAVEPSVIAVGATDRDDNLARFSSRGPVSIGGVSWSKPDLSAPGFAIRAAFPPNGMRALSGTSMAAPHVGGAAVLIMAMCPCLERDIDKVQVILQATAEHLTPPHSTAPLCGNDTPTSIPNSYFGYGRINVKEAIKTCQKLCTVKQLLQLQQS
jgi:hypothetical protein